MARLGKLALGFVTVLPAASFVMLFASPSLAEGLHRAMLPIVVLCSVLFGFYLWHAATQLDKEDRVPWLIVLMAGGMIGMPIYWYRHVWTRGRGDGPRVAAPTDVSSSSLAE